MSRLYKSPASRLSRAPREAADLTAPRSPSRRPLRARAWYIMSVVPRSFRRRSCTRWRTCPVRDLSAIDYSIYTVFFGFDILCVAYLVLRLERSCPEPSASCWRSMAWPTWPTASRTFSRRGLQPI